MTTLKTHHPSFGESLRITLTQRDIAVLSAAANLLDRIRTSVAEQSGPDSTTEEIFAVPESHLRGILADLENGELEYSRA